MKILFSPVRFANMSQLPLFRSEPDESQPPQSDPAYVRKSLNRLLRIARDAQIMPWSEGETDSWEKLFPELAVSLPSEEAAELIADFRRQLKRLRSIE